ncbi:hypothetical protein LDR16_001106 [Salmonella enterica]|nr:hypothetical protein [Salmonella enterica]EIE5967833.1 hypothetical protein [Salmonella enterica]
MKTILKNVQLAVAGTSEDGHAITADMLRTIVSNFKGNNYPQIVKGSLSQKTERHEVVGYVTFVYFKECNGEAALFGDLEFIQFYDMSTLKETFDNRVYPAIEITIQHPGYESLYRLAFTDIQFTKGLRKVNFRKCECIGREEHVQKTLEPSAAVLFNKKYDNEKSGFIGYVQTDDTKKPQAIRLVSSFIPAINAHGKDEKSIDLIRRIITVVGASENCRQDEVEAAFTMSLEELIDRLVRDWHAAFQPSS